jgi:hypothetical protein
VPWRCALLHDVYHLVGDKRVTGPRAWTVRAAREKHVVTNRERTRRYGLRQSLRPSVDMDVDISERVAQSVLYARA